MSFGKLLANPNKFFKQEKVGGSLQWPVLLVFLTGATLAMSTLLSSQPIVRATEGALAAVVIIPYVVAGMAGIMMVFIGWFILSSLLYFITKPVADGGSFGRTMRLIGWTFFPLTVSGAISAVVVSIVVSSLPTPETAAELQRMQSQLSSSQLVRMNQLVSSIFYIWQGLLLMFAIKYGREVSLRTAAIIASLPVLGSVGWSLSVFL